MFDTQYDVVVIGGGAAGLSAALQLTRSRRSVPVLDAGEPRKAPAAGMHGSHSRDGVAPATLLELGRAEVRGYGQVVEAHVSSASRQGDGFAVTVDYGRVLNARRLRVTTGLVDELPNVPGVRERRGREAVHCPYCHGWEVRDQAVGVLATGPMAMYQVLLFRQMASDLMLFTHTERGLNEEQVEQLAVRGMQVVEGVLDALEITGDRLTGVRLHDGRVVPRQALVVMPRLAARSHVLADLGLLPTPLSLGIGESIVATNATGLTDIPGLWVAGNVDLIAEDTRQAVAAYRAETSAVPAGIAASAA
jgi:thioredoxin reductase